MAFCSNCGVNIEDSAKFCPNCGAEAAPEQPVYTAPGQEYAQPAYSQPEQQAYQPYAPQGGKDEADAMINGAFGKALAAAICASFPIASIIAIILGSGALKVWLQARAMAEAGGFTLTGKHIPTRILGLIGKIAGIIMTVVWAIYILAVIIAAA